MSVADPLTFVGQDNSFKKMTSLTKYSGETEEDSSVECVLLNKLKEMAITENNEAVYEDEEKAAEKESDEELIERGPTKSRCRQRVNPYPSASDSPSSCSESSQGSPLNYNNDRCYPSGGSVVVINKTSSFESLNEDSLPSPDSTPNRQVYMHKNGGQVHLVSPTITTPTVSSFLNNNAPVESHHVSNGISSELHLPDNMSSLPYLNRPRHLEVPSRDECRMSDILINSPSPFSVSSNASSTDYRSSSSPDVRNESMLFQMEKVSINRPHVEYNEVGCDDLGLEYFNSRIPVERDNELSNNGEHFALLNDDMPEEVKEFLVDQTNSSTIGKLKNEEYFEVVEGILKNIDHDNTIPNVNSLEETNKAVEYPREHAKCINYGEMCPKSLPVNFNDNIKQNLIKEDCLQDAPLIPFTVEQVNKCPTATNKIKSPPKKIQTQPCRDNLISGNTYQIITTSPTIIIMPPNGHFPALKAQNSQRKLPVLAPKPEPPKVNLVQVSTNPDCKKMTPQSNTSQEQGVQALRDFILSKFTDEERRKRHCAITKIPDEKIIQRLDDDGDTLLHVSVIDDVVLTSIFLIERFSKLSALDTKNIAGETPLLNAIIFQKYELVKYLLCLGADPNCLILKNGSTVLHYVAQRGASYLKFLELLCQHPLTEINKYNNEGKTPLMYAVESHGKEFMFNDQSCIINSEQTVRHLLKYKASVTLPERKSGKTAFHLAVEKKDFNLLQILCSSTTDIEEAINVPMYDGNTPLHLLCSMNDCEINLRIAFINLMLKNGASVKLQNYGKKFPSELVDKRCKEIKRLFSPIQH